MSGADGRSDDPRAGEPGAAAGQASTGIQGLDDVLGGGFARGRLHLLQGAPGAGKTTLAVQFLLSGAARGESCLLLSLSETAEEVDATARSNGWPMYRIHVHDVSALARRAGLDFQQRVFRTAEVELTEATRQLLAAVDEVKPDRVVFDPIAELRLLA